MVCWLAWRCCIKRWVKKRSNRGAKLVAVVMVVMVDPPSIVPGGTWLHASAQERPPNTTAYLQRAHGRGRRTRVAGVARGPDRNDTSSPACSWRIGVASRAGGGRGDPRRRAARSGGTACKRRGGSAHCPSGCPN